MRKFPMMVAIALMAVGVTGFAQTRPRSPDGSNVHYAWADVTRVDPVYSMVQVDRPRQQCYQQPVVRSSGSGDNTAGTILGAVVGGVLGNTVGKGDGRKAATVAGAVAGGAIGHGVAQRDDRVEPGTVTQCNQVSDVSRERRIVGYDVEYRYRGDVYLSRLDYDPGERLRVRVSVSPAD